MSSRQFDTDGFYLTNSLFNAEYCQEIITRLCLDHGQAGNREMLAQHWCADLARELLSHQALDEFLPKDYGAIQCTYFEKSQATNWLVALHQDLAVPIANALEHPDFKRSSYKGEDLYLQAPDYVLRGYIALRLHLEDCRVEDGALGVIKGSHIHGRLKNEEIAKLKTQQDIVFCPVACGAAMLMRPLLLHMSSKSRGQSKRRVLHFLFAPRPTIEGFNYLHFIVP